LLAVGYSLGKKVKWNVLENWELKNTT
jgi:hypothetical protein